MGSGSQPTDSYDVNFEAAKLLPGVEHSKDLMVASYAPVNVVDTLNKEITRFKYLIAEAKDVGVMEDEEEDFFDITDRDLTMIQEGLNQALQLVSYELGLYHGHGGTSDPENRKVISVLNDMHKKLVEAQENPHHSEY